METNEEIFNALLHLWNNPPENLLTFSEKFDWLQERCSVWNWEIRMSFYLTFWNVRDDVYGELIAVGFRSDETHKILAVKW